jgi:hypothetical protein
MRAALILALTALVTLACLLLVLSRDAPQHTSLEPPLPKIAPAPGFALTSQDGAAVTLADFRGRVLAVTFIRWSWAHWRPGATLKVIVHDTDLRTNSCASVRLFHLRHYLPQVDLTSLDW